MFIEVMNRQSKNGLPCWKLRLCENVRVGGKPRKKAVRNIGTAHSPSELEDMKRFGAKVMEAEVAKRENCSLLFDSSQSLEMSPFPDRAISNYRNLKETNRLIEGALEVFSTLFQDSGFCQLLSKENNEILQNVVIARIEDPASKRKSQINLKEKHNYEISLNSIYRMMDKLFGRIEKVSEIAIQDAKTLFDQKIDLVLFDVTTLYFESVEVDELREFGYSKDQKFHSTQVVLAMGVTSQGLPIGYKLFPGSTAETTTLIASLDACKKEISIGRVVFVADRGMFNSKNLWALEQAGYEYVVGAKLRNQKPEIKKNILDKIGEEKLLKEETSKSVEIPHEILVQKKNVKKGHEEIKVAGKLIVSYSQKRASKDKNDRVKIIEKMQKILGKAKDPDASKLVSNKGYLKYAGFTGKKPTSVDEKKVQEDEKWDCIHGLFTNAQLNSQEAQEYYRQLWTIEETFRVSKSDIEMRPIYHFNPKRIQAHIAICFISLYLVRKLQLLLALEGIKASAQAIQESLAKVQSSHVLDRGTGFQFLLPSAMPPLADQIYKTLGIRRSLTPRPL